MPLPHGNMPSHHAVTHRLQQQCTTRPSVCVAYCGQNKLWSFPILSIVFASLFILKLEITGTFTKSESKDLTRGNFLMKLRDQVNEERIAGGYNLSN